MRALRFSIAGLMGVVVLAAIAAAGLARPSEPWAGVIVLLTRGTLCLALVGAVCQTGAARAWWVGFASFGWLYLSFHSYDWLLYHNPLLPTHAILTMLGPMVGISMEDQIPRAEAGVRAAYFLIGDCVWALAAGIIGGYLARSFFGVDVTTAEARGAIDPSAPHADERSRALPLAVLVLGLLLIAWLVVAGEHLDTGIWAGAIYLLTWYVLGMMALGAVFARGRRKEVWLGGAFLGMGFLFLVFSRPPFESRQPELFIPTVEFLEALRPSFTTLVAGLSGDPDSPAATNARIRKALKQRVPMRFPDDTPLENVLTYIKQATRTVDGKVIPIYVDPIGLREAEKSVNSRVSGLNFEGVTLQTSLRRCLKQLDMTYAVRNDLLVITSLESEDTSLIAPNADPFLVAGHCLLALIAAGLGGLAAPFVCGLARGQRGTAQR